MNMDRLLELIGEILEGDEEAKAGNRIRNSEEPETYPVTITGPTNNDRYCEIDDAVGEIAGQAGFVKGISAIDDEKMVMFFVELES